MALKCLCPYDASLIRRRYDSGDNTLIRVIREIRGWIPCISRISQFIKKGSPSGSFLGLSVDDYGDDYGLRLRRRVSNP